MRFQVENFGCRASQSEGAALGDEVPLPTICERARRLRALATQEQRSFREAQVGRTLKVLTLRRRRPDGQREALSENYLKVVLAGPDLAANQLLRARITGVEEDRLVGAGVSGAATRLTQAAKEH